MFRFTMYATSRMMMTTATAAMTATPINADLWASLTALAPSAERAETNVVVDFVDFVDEDATYNQAQAT